MLKAQFLNQAMSNVKFGKYSWCVLVLFALSCGFYSYTHLCRPYPAQRETTSNARRLALTFELQRPWLKLSPSWMNYSPTKNLGMWKQPKNTSKSMDWSIQEVITGIAEASWIPRSCHSSLVNLFFFQMDLRHRGFPVKMRSKSSNIIQRCQAKQ